MLEKHKMPSLEAGLLIILVVISVFSIGLSTGPEVTGMAVKNKKCFKYNKKVIIL